MYLGSKQHVRWTVFLFLGPVILVFLVFRLVPFLGSLYLSFLDWDVLRPFADAEWVGLDNFSDWLTGGELKDILFHTLYYMVLYIPLVILLAVLEGAMLNQDMKGIKAYKAMFYLPVITSWVAGAIIWKFILNGKYGFLNQWLSVFGIQGPAWLTNPVWAMPGVVLACLWKDTGFYALIVLAGLKGINPVYYEAARVDGAGPFRRFLKITLPLLSPTLFLLLIYNVIGGFQVFESIFIMTDGGPANSTTVIVERIYRYAFKIYKIGYASALAWILFLIILVVTLIQFRLENKVHYED